MIKGSIVTIGVFDGLHVGHRKIIQKVVARARKRRLKSVVVTFDPHPTKVLKPHIPVPSLISLKHRINIVKSMGIDRVEVLKFTKSLAALPPERFIKDLLVRKLNMKEMYVGENFYFGRDARAGAGSLKGLSRIFGFKIGVIKPVRLDGRIISSSLIRKLIISGRLKQAQRLLGRPVSVLGTVVPGYGRGRFLGFPTANVDPHHEAIPPSGVYAVKVYFKKKAYGGVLNIGFRPTFHKAGEEVEPTIEVNIFGFNKIIYNKDIEIIFIRKLRSEYKFKHEEHLMHQIMLDASRAMKLLYKSLRVC